MADIRVRQRTGGRHEVSVPEEHVAAYPSAYEVLDKPATEGAARLAPKPRKNPSQTTAPTEGGEKKAGNDRAKSDKKES